MVDMGREGQATDGGEACLEMSARPRGDAPPSAPHSIAATLSAHNQHQGKCELQAAGCNDRQPGEVRLEEAAEVDPRQSSSCAQRDVDPFHTQSHPVRDPGENRGSVYVQAHEAVLDYDRAAQGSSSKCADAVRWRGMDSEKREVEIWTDRCEVVRMHCPSSRPLIALSSLGCSQIRRYAPPNRIATSAASRCAASITNGHV